MTTTALSHDEPELTASVLLCGTDGLLNREAVGWSRHPLHTCNLPSSLARKKKWNYWAVTSNDLLFSATIADVDIFQLAGAYIFDRRTHRHIEKTVIQPANTIAIPETISGDMVIEHPDMRVALTDEGSGTRIRVEARDFGGMRLEADIVVERPEGHETLNVVIPWSDIQFQYTSKQNTLPASGFVLARRRTSRIRVARVRLSRLRSRRLARAHGLELGFRIGRAGRAHRRPEPRRDSGPTAPA